MHLSDFLGEAIVSFLESQESPRLGQQFLGSQRTRQADAGTSLKRYDVRWLVREIQDRYQGIAKASMELTAELQRSIVALPRVNENKLHIVHTGVE
jgi:hypothetical protein